MATSQNYLAGYELHLSEYTRQHGVPGAAVAVLIDDTIDVVCSGVANTATGEWVTPDTLFQIGSITKLYTATMVMRCIEQGLFELDTPLAELLPEAAASTTLAAATPRMLLTHTSGLHGDVFDDTGSGEDCLARHTALIGAMSPFLALGGPFSYCNSGFVVAGRLLEAVGKGCWDDLLRQDLLDPLGLNATVTLPEDALRHRVAVGHLPGPSGAQAPSHVWNYVRGVGPAGLICASAADLLGFARLHLRGGRAPSGDSLLEHQSVACMQQAHASLPPGWLASSWGLGWIRYASEQTPVVGHDGGTVAQRASLRVLPQQNAAVVVLTNAKEGSALSRQVLRDLLPELGADGPAQLEPAAQQPDESALAQHVGTYRRYGEEIDITLHGGHLQGRFTTLFSSGRKGSPASVSAPLRALDDATFLQQQGGEWVHALTFGGPTDTEPAWLFTGRMNLRSQPGPG